MSSLTAAAVDDAEWTEVNNSASGALVHHAASRSAPQRPLPPPPPSAPKPKAAATASFEDSNHEPADAEDDVASDHDGDCDGDGGTDESGCGCGGSGSGGLSPRDLVALVELLAFADFALLFHLKDSALSALHGAMTVDNACLCLVAADIHKVRRCARA